MTSLQALISLLRVSGVNGEFIPQNPLFDLLTPEAITAELARASCPVEDIAEVTGTVSKWGQKTFAILTEMNALGYVSHFMAGNLLDAKLPFSSDDLLRVVWPDKPWLCTSFRKFQVDYVAPFLGYIPSHSIFREPTVLPFMEERKLSEGAFGKAFAVTLHPGHQGFFQGQEAVSSPRWHVVSGSRRHTNSGTPRTLLSSSAKSSPTTVWILPTYYDSLRKRRGCSSC
jgi:hypothetical protein